MPRKAGRASPDATKAPVSKTPRHVVQEPAHRESRPQRIAHSRSPQPRLPTPQAHREARRHSDTKPSKESPGAGPPEIAASNQDGAIKPCPGDLEAHNARPTPARRPQPSPTTTLGPHKTSTTRRCHQDLDTERAGRPAKIEAINSLPINHSTSRRPGRRARSPVHPTTAYLAPRQEARMHVSFPIASSRPSARPPRHAKPRAMMPHDNMPAKPITRPIWPRPTCTRCQSPPACRTPP